jgi:phenylalanyl-tRNA synthetase beta chain
MKLPLSWLKEFVTIDASLDELSRRLTMAGLEVEGIDHSAPTFDGVFIAKVLHVERHPNADRLNLCEVDAGPAGHFKVVCGAPNARAGMTAALAKVGARLAGGAHGQGTGKLEDATPLQAAVIRGVQSEGMLCSELELGLSADHQGILELPTDAPAGHDLANYLQMADTVLDIAITPNRGDCLSILGLAREIAALFGLRLHPPRVRALKAPSNSLTADATSVLTVDIRASELCPRYAALPMAKVKIGPSPVLIRRRLELCGMRALNNVVDVTNYVMLELGQPLHAFDRDRITGDKIVVRRAEDDREFETLDNLKRALEPADLMIADGEKPLALAGVMGGLNSEVSATTTRIVLESAFFEPMTIARTARRLGLRSEASYRFERGIDRAGQAVALMRAADLIRRYAGGRESGPIVDLEARPAPYREIDLDLRAMSSILGVEVPPAEVRRRLKAIGATVTPAGRNRLKVLPPPFRPDLNETADLAEEVARLAGLAEIPATVPTRAAVVNQPNPGRALTRRTRDVMLGCGLVEAKTIAFIAPAENARYAGLDDREPVRVANPLSAELSEMRRSLLPGLIAALRFNLNREATAFHAFELGKVFGLRDGIPAEAERIAAVSYGDYAMGAVGQPAVKAGFWTIKGVVEAYFRAFGIAQMAQFEPAGTAAPYLHPGRSATVKLDGKLVGVVGELHPAEALRLELNDPAVLFELDSQHLLAYVSLARQAIKPPPRFPAIRRDLALVVDRDFPAERVRSEISAIASPLLESVELFDVYEGVPIAQGKKSVALACRYRAGDRTLTDEEVNRAHTALIDQAKALLGAELRQ